MRPSIGKGKKQSESLSKSCQVGASAAVAFQQWIPGKDRGESSLETIKSAGVDVFLPSIPVGLSL